MQTYKYLDVLLDNKLDWSANVSDLYRKGQSRLFFLRRLRSFDVCSNLLLMFYQTVETSALFYASLLGRQHDRQKQQAPGKAGKKGSRPVQCWAGDWTHWELW